MPIIYETTCSACGYVSPEQSEGYLAVIMDEPSLSMHVHPDDPRIVVLGHPCEDMILEELGYTFETAGRGGRLLYFRNVVCRKCGTMYEIRRLGTASPGCFACLGFLTKKTHSA